jgi:glutathione S-transferase
VYRLHCFAQSGNCFKVAFLLRALRQPYETVFVDYLHGATRDPEWREHTNEMGEVPVLEDGARRLTQSGAILVYLSEKHGELRGADADERHEVLRWLMFDNHKFTSYFATYRFLTSFAPTPPEPVVMHWLKGRVEAAFAVVDKHLARREFMVGDAPTIADLSLPAYLFYPERETRLGALERYRNIAAWVERVKAIPGWAAPYDVLPGPQPQPKW